MKKLSTGFVAIALCLGLTACGNDEQKTGEITTDPNQMESPAAGYPPSDTQEDPATQQNYGTGTGTGTGMGTMDQAPDDSATMPGTENPPQDIREGGATPQQ